MPSVAQSPRHRGTTGPFADEIGSAIPRLVGQEQHAQPSVGKATTRRGGLRVAGLGTRFDATLNDPLTKTPAPESDARPVAVVSRHRWEMARDLQRVSALRSSAGTPVRNTSARIAMPPICSGHLDRRAHSRPGCFGVSGPPRAGDLGLRASVERTGAENAPTRIRLGVSGPEHARSGFQSSASCAGRI
jgi:hypothetical protein